MLSEDRLKHMLGVARKCRAIAESMGKDEKFCEKMWVIGLMHDAGYEFSDDHETKSSELLQILGITDYEILQAVRQHGKYGPKENLVWRILVMADLQVDTHGKEVPVSERLADIGYRHGFLSDEYLTCCDNAYVLGLTAENLAGATT